MRMKNVKLCLVNVKYDIYVWKKVFVTQNGKHYLYLYLIYMKLCIPLNISIFNIFQIHVKHLQDVF